MRQETKDTILGVSGIILYLGFVAFAVGMLIFVFTIAWQAGLAMVGYVLVSVLIQRVGERINND